MEDTLLLWGLALLAGAFALLVLEVFVPSGGLISILAAGVAIFGIVTLFRYDTTWGLLGILVVLVLGPVVFAFAMKIWPNTPIGRRMLHGETTEEDMRRKELEDLEREKQRQSLIGREADVITDLRPVGTIRLDGKRIQAVAETGIIDAGERVRIVRFEGNDVTVRKIT